MLGTFLRLATLGEPRRRRQLRRTTTTTQAACEHFRFTPKKLPEMLQCRPRSKGARALNRYRDHHAREKRGTCPMPSPHEVEVFCCRYVANGNATQAYVEAIPRA